MFKRRETDPTWKTESSCCIYIDPTEPSLGLVFFLREQELLSGSLHLCKGKYLHYFSEGVEERVRVKPKPSIRAQATRMVRHVLDEWRPATVLIGTGNPDAPQIISALELPKIWENRSRRMR